MNHDALDILDAVELPAQTLERLRPRPGGLVTVLGVAARAPRRRERGEHGCPRRWWLSSVCGETEPELPHQAEGRRLHAESAQYLLHGTQPGPVASTVIEYLPTPPVPPENVERPFALIGLPVMTVGAVDVAWTKPDRIAVRDLKFVSSIRREHRQQDLFRDPQAILYSAALQPTCWPAHRFPVVLGETSHPVYRLAPASTGVEFCKVYASRSTPKAELVGAYLAPEVIDDGMARIAAQMLTMQERAQIERVDAVPPNPHACRSYGVMCPHRGLCDLLGDAMVRNPFPKKTNDPAALAAVNAEAQTQLMAPPPPTPPTPPAPPEVPAPPPPTESRALTILPSPGEILPTPPLSELERVAKAQKASGMNRNAARPAVSNPQHYFGYDAPRAETTEHALRNVYGPYTNLGDAAYALSEHRRLRTPFTEWDPAKWHDFFRRSSAPDLPLPTLWDIACYVFDGAARAEERGYKYEGPATAPYVVETLPAMSTEEKAAMMGDLLPESERLSQMADEGVLTVPKPPAPPAPKPPRKGAPTLPDHPAIPEFWRGFVRSQLTSQIAPRCRTDLAVACRDAGHDVAPGAADLTVKGLRAEIARLAELLTGVLPWEADESPEVPPAPPVPSSDTTSAVVTSAPPAPASTTPPLPPEPPASSDVAGGVSPSRTTVYVDCMPMGVVTTDFSQWIAPFEERAGAELGHDYRLPKFKEGYRLVASLAFRALRDRTVELPEALFVSTRHPLFEELESIIAQFSPFQVRAVR